MAKNKGSGGNRRRRGKRSNDDPRTKETVFKEDGMGYGYVEKTLGNNRFHVTSEDGTKRMGILRGSLRRKVWIINGDVVLYGMREFQDSKIDIVHKYSNEDVTKLYQYGELPKFLYDMYTSDTHNKTNDDQDDIHFVNEGEENEPLRPTVDLTQWTKIDPTKEEMAVFLESI
jgi:translation initiation factor 1A